MIQFLAHPERAYKPLPRQLHTGKREIGFGVMQPLPCINQAIIRRHITLFLHARLSHR